MWVINLSALNFHDNENDDTEGKSEARAPGGSGVVGWYKGRACRSHRLVTSRRPTLLVPPASPIFLPSTMVSHRTFSSIVSSRK